MEGMSEGGNSRFVFDRCRKPDAAKLAGKKAGLKPRRRASWKEPR